MLCDLRAAVINTSCYPDTKCSASPVSGRVTLPLLRGCLVKIKMHCVIIKISNIFIQLHFLRIIFMKDKGKKCNCQLCSEAARFSLQEALTVRL